MQEYVTLGELARDVGIDKSNLRKFCKRNKIALHRKRTASSGGQVELCLTQDDADLVTDMRRDGYQTNDPEAPGFFYIIQPVPELDPLRVKFGFTRDVTKRLASYRTICPNVALVSLYPCQPHHEQTAIDSISMICTHVGGEVYTCDELHFIMNRAKQFFGLFEV